MLRKNDLWKIAVTVLLLAWVYAPAIWWMVDRWGAKDSYYGHGPLIPLVSGLLLWWRRKELAALPAASSGWGWLWVTLGVVLQALSALSRIYFVSALSFFPLLVGLILLWGGKPLWKEIWFPVLFLLFMVPLPLEVVAQMAFWLKLIAANLSAKLLASFGFPIIQNGSTLYLPHVTVMVEDVCSGLRSLISLVALGVLCAYTMRSTRVRRLLLLAATVPIAISANIFRITVLCFVGELYGTQMVTGLFHDTMGYVAFGIAFLLFQAFGNWLK